MNIRGIELLRALKLPGPRKELISSDLSNVDLEELYDGARVNATILAFDYTEPINQNPLYEKNVRKYKVKREEYFEVLDKLIEQLSQKGVRREDMRFLTHQTYVREDISISGRIGIEIGKNGFGQLMIDAIESLRKANSDFNPTFVYQCPIVGERIFRSREIVEREQFSLPKELVARLIRDVYRIPGNPYVDFEVYADSGQLFYHDLFLSQTVPQ